MAIGGLGGALLAGLQGYSKARAAEQDFATAELERQRQRMALDLFQQQQQAAVARWRALQRLGQQPLAGGGGGPMYPPGAGGMPPQSGPSAPITREPLPPLPGFGGGPLLASGGGDQGAAARTRDFGQPTLDPLYGNPIGGGTQASGAAPGGMDPLTGNPLAGLNALNNGFSGSSRGGPGIDPGAGGDDTGLAPGFQRGPTGMLTYQGRPPDTYLGGMLPGGGAMPAWQTGSTSGGTVPRFGPGPGEGFAGSSIPPRGTPERERLVDTIIRDESGGRNIMQQVLPPGGGYNPSVGRVTGPSTASGLGQITDKTLRGVQATDPQLAGYRRAMDMPDYLQRRAINDLIDQRGVRDWVPYNKVLARDLAAMGIDPGGPIAKGGQQALMQTVQNLPQMLLQSQMMSMQGLIKAINDANPDASDAVKAMAFTQGMELLAPYEQERSRMILELMKEDWQQRRLDEREEATRSRDEAKEAARTAREDEEITGTPYYDADKKKWYATTKRGGVKEIPLPPGARKEGVEREQGFEAFRDPQGNLHYLRKGEPIPEGWQRDVRRYVGAQGMALQTFIEEFTREKGHPPGSQDIRNWQAANRLQTSEAGAVGTRSGYLETAANAAESLMPLLVEKSREIDRTQYPTINKIILAFNEQTGDENVVQYGEMINSLRYLYARAMSPTGQARVADLQNFDKIMNEAWTKGQIEAGVRQIARSLAAERKGIEKTREEVTTRGAPGGKATQQGGGTTYKSPDEVKAAVDAGTLDRDAAKKILREQFGMQ